MPVIVTPPAGARPHFAKGGPAMGTSGDNGHGFDAVAFLQRLIAIETCDPPGREIDAAVVVRDQLDALGIEAELDEFAPGRANVLGRVPGAGSKPPLVLSAHLDTVPVGTAPWSSPPFSGALRDGRVHGRGAADMKSAVAAIVAAAVALKRRPEPLAGDVLLAFSAGESSNCLGARRFVERGLQARMGALLVGEPSSLDVIVAEKAALWVRATARGRSGHVSGDAGVNAIAVMMDFLRILETAELPAPPHPLLDGPSLRVGRISGGSAVNVTPDACSAEIDIRLAPGIAPDAVLAMLRGLAPDAVTLETMDFKPAVESAPDSPFVRLCAEACVAEAGRNPAILGVAYFSDATVLAAGLDVPFAIVGPGELGMSAQPDEWVSVEKVEAAARIYRRVAENWLA